MRPITIQEKAKEIKKQLIEELKPKRKRDISVKSGSCGYSSYIDVRLKNKELDLEKAEKIAYSFRKVDRCEVTGEILEGGNTYIDVAYQHGWRTSNSVEVFEMEI